jgi:hypothetical protein
MYKNWYNMGYMNAETAIQINQWIDRFHNPSYWIIFWVIALYVLLEYRIFPKKEIVLDTIYSRIVLYGKFGVLLFTFAIALSQSVLGGCAIQLIQNYLAVQYLDREYWYPFGLVFRENLQPQYWIWLRLFYGALTIGYGFWIYRYYRFVRGKLSK